MTGADKLIYVCCSAAIVTEYSIIVAQIKLKTPFDVMYKAPKNGTLHEMLGYMDSNHD